MHSYTVKNIKTTENKMKLESTQGEKDIAENTVRNAEIKNVKCKQDETEIKKEITVVMVKFCISDCGGGYMNSQWLH